jgi:hypothetical protein
MRRFAIVMCGLLAIASAVYAQTLEQLKSGLEKEMAGNWRLEEETNTSIGPMLVHSPYPTNTWPGFVGVLPFGQDAEGRRKVEFYMSICQAPLYVLGCRSNLTVITYMSRSNAVCQKITALLKLSLPPFESDIDRRLNVTAIAGAAADEKELLRHYKGEVILPAELYQTYTNMVAAFQSGKQEKIEEFCLPGKIAFTTKPRPKEGREYGQDVNLPFLKEGFHAVIENIAKVSETEYGIRTGSTHLSFTKTKVGKWKLSKYFDKPIE